MSGLCKASNDYKIRHEMLNYAMKTWRDNLSFLVEPKEPAISALRAVKNMGSGTSARKSSDPLTDERDGLPAMPLTYSVRQRPSLTSRAPSRQGRRDRTSSGPANAARYTAC